MKRPCSIFITVICILALSAPLLHHTGRMAEGANINAANDPDSQHAPPVEFFVINVGPDMVFLPSSIVDTWKTLSQGQAQAGFVWDRAAIDSSLDSIRETYAGVKDVCRFESEDGEIFELENHGCGWVLDSEETVSNIISALDNGEKTASSVWRNETEYRPGHDIGGNYVEVDISRQKVFLFKNYEIMSESDCVTGLANGERNTKEGAFCIEYMASPAVLRGYEEDGSRYASHVTYWMPFNGGQGLHDAPWRKAFGGDIYLKNGSHGCVNLPEDMAKILYDNVYPGFAVVVHE